MSSNKDEDEEEDEEVDLGVSLVLDCVIPLTCLARDKSSASFCMLHVLLVGAVPLAPLN